MAEVEQQQQQQTELRKWEMEWEAQKLQFEVKLQLLRAVVDVGLFIVKSMMIMNAGAIMAMITFNPERLSDMKFSLYMFVGGIVSAILSAGAAFIGNNALVTDNEKSSEVMYWLTVATALSSIAFFLVGASYAVEKLPT